MKAAVGGSCRSPSAVDAIGRETFALFRCDKLSSSHSPAFRTMHRTLPLDNKKALGRIASPKGFDVTQVSGLFKLNLYDNRRPQRRPVLGCDDFNF